MVLINYYFLYIFLIDFIILRKENSLFTLPSQLHQGCIVITIIKATNITGLAIAS